MNTHTMDTPTKRPTLNDPAIIEAAAERMLPEVMKWMDDVEITSSKGFLKLRRRQRQ